MLRRTDEKLFFYQPRSPLARADKYSTNTFHELRSFNRFFGPAKSSSGWVSLSIMISDADSQASKKLFHALSRTPFAPSTIVLMMNVYGQFISLSTFSRKQNWMAKFPRLMRLLNERIKNRKSSTWANFNQGAVLIFFSREDGEPRNLFAIVLSALTHTQVGSNSDNTNTHKHGRWTINISLQRKNSLIKHLSHYIFIYSFLWLKQQTLSILSRRCHSLHFFSGSDTLHKQKAQNIQSG